MAGDETATGERRQFRIDGAATVLHERTARSEAASDGDLVRAGQISHEFVAMARFVGMRRWDRRQQRLGIGMRRRTEQLIGVRDFDDAAEIHHRNPVRNVPDH